MVTRDDVAKMAGVSPTTVSHVINNTRFVSAELRGKVFKAVDDLKYTPNFAARSLTTKKSNQVALIVNDIANPFYGEIALGMESAAIENGYILILCVGNEKFDRYIDNFIMRQVEGVYITSLIGKLKKEGIQKLVNNGISVVFGSDTSEVYKSFSDIASFLSVDFSNGINQIFDYLLNLGHKNIGFLNGLHIDDNYNERFISYKKCFKKNGLKYNKDYVIKTRKPFDTSIEGGYETMKKIINEKIPITAVIATNDLMAIGALKAINEAKMSVPDDISVIGCDNILFSNTTTPPLTTLDVPKYEMGRKAFNLLIQNHEQNLKSAFFLPSNLIVRGTTGPVKK